MKRTIRASSEDWKMLALVWTTATVGLSVASLDPKAHVLSIGQLPLAYILVRITLQVVLARVEVDAEGIVVRSLKLRRGRTLHATDILRYACIQGFWFVVVKDRTTHVPIDPPADVHAAMAEIHPKKLNAKRLRMRGVPPTEEFVGLWTFDLRKPPPETLAFAFLFIALVALVPVPLVAVASAGLFALLVLLRMSGRLDVTTEGLAMREPFRTRRIAWSEVTAIFCEKPKKGRRSFVVTAPGRAIPIPAHLARDLETMRKLLCSLPDDTRCVNFDATTFRGYRRRKRAQKPARPVELLPALTA